MRGDEQESPETTELGSREGRAISRREFLKYAGLAGAVIGVGSGLGGFLAACGGGATTTTAGGATTTVSTGPVSQEPIKIGGLWTMSSIIAEIAQEQKRGFDIAIEEVGPVQGRPVELSVSDITTQDSEVSEAQRQIQSGAKVIMGSAIDAFDKAAVPIAEQNKVPLWLTLTGGPELTSPGSPWVFRTCHWSSLEGQVQAEWIVKEVVPALKVDPKTIKVGLVHQNDSWGTRMGETAAGILKDAGLDVPVNQSFDATTIKDMNPNVLKMKSAGVNVVVATQFPGPGKLFWDAARTLDFNPLALCGTGGYEGTSTALTDQGAAGVDGWLSTNFPVENTNPELAPEAAKFVETYKKKYNAEHLLTCHSLSGYAGMLFLLDALKRTQDLNDPESLRTAILATDIPEKKIGNGWGCQFSTADKPFNGMTGQNTRVFDVGIQWQEGQMWTMYPLAYPGRTLQLPMKTWAEKKA